MRSAVAVCPERRRVGGRARILWGTEAFEVPAGLLPEGTTEGTWLRLTLAAVPASSDEEEGEAIRRRLRGGDDGGDIKL